MDCKKFKAILFIIILIAMVLFAAGVLVTCAPETHEVFFESNGGTEFPSVFVRKNMRIDDIIPEKEHFAFLGWHYDRALEKPIAHSIEIEKLGNDSTLYAKWELRYQLLPDGTYAFTGGRDLTGDYVMPNEYEGIPITVVSRGFGNAKLNSIIIPKSVKLIQRNAFYDCHNLNSVTFESGTHLTRIEEEAFKNCEALTEIVLPRVDSLKSNAFDGCTELKTVVLSPQTIVADGVFLSCTAIEQVQFGTSCINIQKNFGNSVWYQSQPDGIIYDGTIALGYRGQAHTANVLTIKDGITEIADGAFRDTDGIAEIKLPNGLLRIGKDAFKGTDFYTVQLPDSLKEMGDNAFQAKKVSNQGVVSYEGNRLIEMVDKVPQSLTYAGENTFFNCSKITEVPDGLLHIGKKAFLGTGWQNAQPDGVVYYKNIAIGYNGTIPEGGVALLTLKEGTEEIGDGAFSSIGINEVTIPSSVKRIGNDAFAGARIKKITIENGVEEIGDNAFYSNDFTEISIPSSVKRIGDNAFQYGNLSRVTLHDGIFEFGKDPFFYNPRLSSIWMPKSVQYIGSFNNFPPFVILQLRFQIESPPPTFQLGGSAEAHYGKTD